MTVPTLPADRVGMWDYHLNYHEAADVRAWVAELEERGVGSIWVGESRFRDPFVLAGIILSVTQRITVATGIASIWSRDAFATVASQAALAEAYEGRFLLGLGVSHRALVEDLRGHRYSSPLAAMRNYLDDMDKAWTAYQAVKPAERPPFVLAALGSRMMELAAERANGAHTYFVPPEHTRWARQILGPGALLIPEQAVVLERNPDQARQIARSHIRRYLPLPNYVANLRRLGFDDDDFIDNGSDRLVDAIVAHGDDVAVFRRVQQHRDAGADHVCLHILSPTHHQFPASQWRSLLGMRSS